MACRVHALSLGFARIRASSHIDANAQELQKRRLHKDAKLKGIAARPYEFWLSLPLVASLC